MNLGQNSKNLVLDSLDKKYSQHKAIPKAFYFSMRNNWRELEAGLGKSWQTLHIPSYDSFPASKNDIFVFMHLNQ